MCFIRIFIPSLHNFGNSLVTMVIELSGVQFGLKYTCDLRIERAHRAKFCN